MLGQTGRSVSVMVLDAHRLNVLTLEGVLGGEVLRVQIVSDQLRLHREELLEVLDPLREGTEGLVVLQVADVVADPGPLALGEAEGALELGAAGQDRSAGRQGQSARNVAA